MQKPETIVMKAIAVILVPSAIVFLIFAPVEYWKPMLGAVALCVAITVAAFRFLKKGGHGRFIVFQIIAFCVILKLFGAV